MYKNQTWFISNVKGNIYPTRNFHHRILVIRYISIKGDEYLICRKINQFLRERNHGNDNANDKTKNHLQKSEISILSFYVTNDKVGSG